MLNRMEMVRIFCTAAEAGSFREAATRLGISPQGVTRAIQALETELGESLFHRNTRHVSITAFGQDYAKDARSALEHFDTLFRSHSVGPERSGRVGITAPPSDWQALPDTVSSAPDSCPSWLAIRPTPGRPDD
ncbi:LysR family transcriptional regulator [Pseudomonas aeruginosa]